jgi:hypothetical protein
MSILRKLDDEVPQRANRGIESTGVGERPHLGEDPA